MKLKPRLAIYFLIPYLLGIVVGEYTSVLPLWTWLFTLLCLSCAVLLQWGARFQRGKNKWLARLKSKVTLYALLHLAVFASGILRLDIATPSPIPAHFYNAPVSFSGQTGYQPERGKEWEACYASGTLQLLETGETVQAKVLIRFQRLVSLRYGNRLTLSGTLRQPQPQRNPGGFDYQAYLSRKAVFGIIYHQGLLEIGEQSGFPPLRWIEALRLRTEEVIDEAYGIDSLDALLIKGIMLGKRSNLPTDTVETFRNSGNLHVLAVSGLHVGFVATFCYFSLLTFASILGIRSKHPHLTKKVIVLLTIAAVVIYACLVGFRTSVFRAALMASLFLFATVIDRDADIYNLLAFAALILLLLNPTQLWDIGFQLSFVAVTAIVYFVPKMEKPFCRFWEVPDSSADDGSRIGNISATLGRSALKWLILSYLVTLAALLGTTLIIAFHFFRAYPLGIIVGPFAVGFVSLILAFGMASVGAGLVSLLPLAKLFAGLNHAIIYFFLKLLGLFGDASVVMKMKPPTFGTFVVYIAVCLGVTHWRLVYKNWRVATLIGLSVIAIWVWDGAFHEEGRLLEVVTLDVGQGDAAVVKFPDGRVMLVDGGIQYSYENKKKKRQVEYDAGERVVAPYLDVNGVRELELVVLSHQDIDHGGGLAHILKNFEVKGVLGIAEKANYSETIERLREIAQEEEILYEFEYAGEIEVTPTATLNLLHPIDAASTNLMDTDTNDDSLVMKLSYGEVDILFTGDIEAKAETRLITSGQDLRAEVLKVPHHGSRTSSTAPFIAGVQPKFALFSLGIRNRYGFPDAGVVARYQRRGCVILRTDEFGAITLKTDGRRCWFRFHVAEN
ncbi:DNA internalization-related competence protein ComEC/Rec2 [Candidatus Poribacteria bacterium]|nr:MAG: DNA internalization-related competence protein ComEC/Rec2 [Candidatus Poribacteria bacterium]